MWDDIGEAFGMKLYYQKVNPLKSINHEKKLHKCFCTVFSLTNKNYQKSI